MTIASAAARLERVRLAVPYQIACRLIEEAELVLVSLAGTLGETGYGAATPVLDLSGDDAQGALAALQRRILPALEGADATDPAAAMERARAASPGTRGALAAADIALHDLAAKRLGVPLVTMLGGPRRPLVTSVTVGIDEADAMAEAAGRHIARGFRILKVKIGTNPDEDIPRLEAIRRAVGGGVPLRVDANEGYSPSQAITMARALERLGVELFEQPVPHGEPAALATVARATTIPVLADESVKVAEDLAPLVALPACAGANIKLMKCGGIAEARRIDRALMAAGWSSLVGCMDESVAGIAAAAHFAAAAASPAWIDLDGHFDLASDPYRGGLEVRDGALVLSDSPGLGVEPA